jgi:GTPase SAR1 family protein
MIKGFVLFIGPSAAGKTSILRRLVTGEFYDQGPTLGFSQENINKVRLIEIGGQASLREYWKIALEQEPVKVFFIIDITNKNDYSEYLKFIKENANLYPNLLDIITLITNKIDLIKNIPTYLDEKKYFIKSSAKSGEGMLDILEIIANLEGKTESVEQIKGENREVKGKADGKSDDEKAESLLEEFQGKF